MPNLQAAFGVSLSDEVTPGSKSAAASLEELQTRLKNGESAAMAMEKALRTMNKGTVVDVNAFKKLKQELADQRVQNASLTTSIVKLGGHFGESSKDATSFGQQVKTALIGAQGPMGNLSGSVASLASKLGKAGLVGVVILVAAALVAMAVAAAVALVGLAKFGLAAADAYRNERLMLDGMTKVPIWFGIWGHASRSSGAIIQAQIDAIIGNVSQSREEIVGLAGELYRMGVRGKASLQAVADAQAVGGERGKAYALQLIMWNRMLGKSSDETAKIIEKKFGVDARAKAMGLGVQMMKLKENIKFLFSGIKIEGFLKGLHEVTSLFSQSTVTGRALKQILEVLLNPLIGGAGRAGSVVKDLFRNMVIFIQNVIIKCLDLEIAFLRVKNRVYEALNFKGIPTTHLAVIALKVALWSLAVPAAIVGLALFGIALAVAAALAPFVMLGLAVYGLWEALSWIAGKIFGYDWAGLGKWVVGGIADGISGAAKWVYDAIANLASNSIKKFKDLLGIHSNSVAFTVQGRFVPGGYAQGIRKGTPQVHAALRQMTSVAALEPMGGRAGSAIALTSTSKPAQAGNQYIFNIKATEPREVVEEIYRTLTGIGVQLGATG